MRTLRLLPVCLLAVAAGCGGAEPTRPPTIDRDHGIMIVPTTVAGLEEAIAAQKGKVVLIDCWFLGCAPCVKKFPHLVELHEARVKDGLVVISLDVYQDEWDDRDKVLAFLKKQGAAFPNYIFKDDPKAVDAWLTEHKATATPAAVLYDRKGKAVPVPDVKLKDETTIPELVKKLLDEK